MYTAFIEQTNKEGKTELLYKSKATSLAECRINGEEIISI